MKKFNIKWVTKKPIFRGGGHEKPIYRGKLSKKGALGQFEDLSRGLGKREGGGVFEGGLIPHPKAHYVFIYSWL